MVLNRFYTSVRPENMPVSNYRSMEETAMTNFATPGTKTLVALVVFGVLAAGAHAQQAAAGATADPAGATPDNNQPGSSGGSAVSGIGAAAVPGSRKLVCRPRTPAI